MCNIYLSNFLTALKYSSIEPYFASCKFHHILSLTSRPKDAILYASPVNAGFCFIEMFFGSSNKLILTGRF